MQIDFITTNDSKVKLAKERLSIYGVIVNKLSLPIYEIQSQDVDSVSRSKAEQALTHTQKPFIIEDSSLEIKELNNFPGTLLKPVFEMLGSTKIIKLLDKKDSRSARVIGQLIYCNPKKKNLVTFQGTYEGSIAKKPKGVNTRGWLVSKIFIPKNSKKTLAQMNDTEWQNFLSDFRKNDHYEKFGKWLLKNNL